MNKATLELLVEQIIIDIISDRIVEQMQMGKFSSTPRAQNLTILFTGTSYGFEKALNSLQSIRLETYTTNIVFSQSAYCLFKDKINHINNTIKNIRQIYTPEKLNENTLNRILNDSDALLIPTLSFNSAAKISHGISDSIPSKLMTSALSQGIPITAAFDGCCPLNSQRLADGFQITQAHGELLSSNLKALQSYGVKLVSAKQLASELSAPQNTLLLPSKSRTTEVSNRFTGKIFSRQNVIALAPDVREIVINQHTIITPSAVDELRQRHIQLIKK